MLKSIKEFFERNLAPAPGEKEGDTEHRLKLATAALFMEMTRQDEQVTAAERAVAEAAMQRKFGLSAEEAGDLVRLGEEEARVAVDFHPFTSLINERFDKARKLLLIEHLWDVAFADGKLDPYEEHMVRKIAELLYVPHHEFIAAKQRSQQRYSGS